MQQRHASTTQTCINHTTQLQPRPARVCSSNGPAKTAGAALTCGLLLSGCSEL
jgi:hypothetical protein